MPKSTLPSLVSTLMRVVRCWLTLGSNSYDRSDHRCPHFFIDYSRPHVDLGGVRERNYSIIFRCFFGTINAQTERR